MTVKYQILLRILDQIRSEASEKHLKKYKPDALELEKINQARARALIHLYFKVSFGILSFEDREFLVTDGAYDGGIDGYYIDQDNKKIYLIQSKFRSTAENFESKNISLDEILRMDINRILDGETMDEAGNEYSGKIKQLQREVNNIADVARYKYVVVVLANTSEIPKEKLKILTGGHPVEIFDFNRCYEELVFPVVAGSFFTAGDLSIPIDLSNKSSGSKISYTVTTKISDCEITVLFVPAIEIARIMHKYKNSVLKYNPRSYLELEGKSVNESIRQTIIDSETNEFALYNNGITMLSDETFINERIGQKNKAQLIVKNPQIINGGQTSYTLSRIYADRSPEEADEVFRGKEVLVKIITLINNESDHGKRQLIDEISNATNKQTPVINADKFANEVIHQNIQKKVFELFGLLYERKRGEFADGVEMGYIDKNSVIERNLFLRLVYASNGNPSKGNRRKLFSQNDFSDIEIENPSVLNNFHIGYQVYLILAKENIEKRQKVNPSIYFSIMSYVTILGGVHSTMGESDIKQKVAELNRLSESIISEKSKSTTPTAFHKAKKNKKTGELRHSFRRDLYLNSKEFHDRLKAVALGDCRTP
ncbi:AIPR family protein [Paracidovorax oryzae]|uniref:AIPR family protein n=1 Tax=Paracidovorax oryzae TaxID=862720 RepID=UPI000A06DC74|nr:AIPR family protein [Paracidovorax oryzae]